MKRHRKRRLTNAQKAERTQKGNAKTTVGRLPNAEPLFDVAQRGIYSPGEEVADFTKQWRSLALVSQSQD